MVKLLNNKYYGGDNRKRTKDFYIGLFAPIIPLVLLVSTPFFIYFVVYQGNYPAGGFQEMNNVMLSVSSLLVLSLIAIVVSLIVLGKNRRCLRIGLAASIMPFCFMAVSGFYIIASSVTIAIIIMIFGLLLSVNSIRSRLMIAKRVP